jgi:hypothetical protein
MAIAKSSQTILVSISVPAGSSKASPGASGALDARSYYGGALTYKLTNNASAPGVAPIITFQSSPDNTNWFDYYTVGGDTVASSINSGTLTLDRGVMYIRVIVYGNTTNAITAEAGLQAITAV